MNGDNEYIVEFNGVSLNYHDAQGETPAIRGLDFGVKKGEFVSIVGPSGCGKTSVLSIAAGIAVPSGGSVRIEGGRPGYMLQQDHLLDWRTVEGNILLGLEVQGNLNEESRSYALELLKTYGLGEFAGKYPSQLSGGMRQKVADTHPCNAAGAAAVRRAVFRARFPNATHALRRNARYIEARGQNGDACYARYFRSNINGRQGACFQRAANGSEGGAHYRP